MKVQNKVVIITGASSGIGYESVKEFFRQGAFVVMAARSTDRLNALKNELDPENKHLLVVQTDVSQEEDCRNLVNQTIKKFGRIDVLVNNAGISMRALFQDAELDVIRRLMDVNFWGTVYCTKYALPYLLESKGSLVGISSIAGYQGLPGRTGYSSSKFAMMGFLETIRVENLKKGLHVLILSPGFTNTRVREYALLADGSNQGTSPREEGKMMSAEKVAQILCKSIEKRKRTKVLTIQGKLTVLLKKFIPATLDKLAYNHMAKEPDSPFK